MTTKDEKQDKTKQNGAELYAVTIESVLSEQSQIDAARQQAAALSSVNPDKLMVIGKPSMTKEGLSVKFGVKP